MQWFVILFEKNQLTALAIETQFVGKNPASTLKLGMACGAIIVAAKKYALDIIQYTPTDAKQTISGNGHASKEQIRQ